jgi:hypothetical protein
MPRRATGLSPGFNPGNRHPAMTRPEWTSGRGRNNTHIECSNLIARESSSFCVWHDEEAKAGALAYVVQATSGTGH